MEHSHGSNACGTSGNKGMIAAGNRGLQLNSLDDYFRYANCLIQSGITPRGIKTPQQVIVALQYGAELGLKPMQAMSTVMVVNGKPALYGDGMLAVAQSSGVLEDIVETVTGEGGAMVATCKVKRKGRSEVVATFSWADAQRAALTGSDTYKKYPQRMLKHRARAFALRDAFPDVLCGVMCDLEAEELTPTFESGAAQPLDKLESLLTPKAVDADEAAESKLWDNTLMDGIDEYKPNPAHSGPNGEMLFDTATEYA
jgi:hypothetical protein